MSHHKETKTYTTTSADGTTTTTTTTTYYSSSSNGSSNGGHSQKSFHDFTSHFNEDPFSQDFFKKYIEGSGALPSHGQIKKVNYKKQEYSNLPEEFSLFVKPSEKVDYQVSACTGRKRAVLIGINYYNTEYQLKGCINDVSHIKKFIIENYGFDESNMKVLTDDQKNPEFIPTRENMIKAIKWLVHDPQADDSYFFHYSGHGGQVVDESGEEEDGFDETIMPVDFMTKGQIIDDELHAIMVAPLPKGVRLTVIFDCCHSGTVLDLPFMYSTHGVVKESNILSFGGKGLLNAGFSYFKGDKNGALNTLKELSNHEKIRRKNIETKGSPADIIMFSGCKDAQTSADAQEAGEATGAMSYALIKSLTENKNPTYQELLRSIRDILKSKYAQKPQLSAAHEMDMNERFTM